MKKAEIKFRWKMFTIRYFFWLTHPISLLLCRLFGHRWWCGKVVPTDPQRYLLWCRRCQHMPEGDQLEPCGMCSNGCRD